MKVRISELLPRPVEVQVGNGASFPVTGVPLEGVVALIGKYRKDFLHLIASGAEEPDYSSLLTTAPAMVNDVIAYGAGVYEDEEERGAIAKLPAGVKLIALAEIWKLTVPDPKKLRDLLSMVRGQVEEANRAKLSSVPTSPSSAPPTAS